LDLVNTTNKKKAYKKIIKNAKSLGKNVCTNENFVVKFWKEDYDWKELKFEKDDIPPPKSPIEK
jgi:hypothetical protein